MKRRDATSEAKLRGELLAAAERLLSDGGAEALQARKLAAAVGASTMAVYTHFGGIPQLVDALVRAGFVRLGRQLTASPESSDALADLFRLGLAYRRFALDNAALYRVMFGVSVPPGHSPNVSDLTTEGTPTGLAEAQEAFGHLIRAVGRVMAAGRGMSAEPVRLAAQMWSSVHGYVLLELGGYFGKDGQGAETILVPLWIDLAVGGGETRAAATRAARSATRSSKARESVQP